MKISKKVLTIGSAVLLCVAIVITLLYQNDVIGSKKDIITVIILDGTIGETIMPLDVRSQLLKADGIGGLVIYINSPGGTVVGSQEILSHIREYKKRNDIPVVVSMGDLAASGGYYIALGGDEIISNRGTLTGSIGVISQFTYAEGLYGKLGIETETVSSGEYKSMGSKHLTEAERAIMQDLSDNIYEQFVKEISASRNLTLDEVRLIATGQVYSGEQALELGLVDSLGTLQDAIVRTSLLAGLKDYKTKIKESTYGGGILGMIKSLLKVPRTTMKVSW